MGRIREEGAMRFAVNGAAESLIGLGRGRPLAMHGFKDAAKIVGMRTDRLGTRSLIRFAAALERTAFFLRQVSESSV
jgi:hypothetical protein